MIFFRKNRRAGLKTGRIEAFSDGVFAIAITLLVLEIVVPPLTETQIAHGQLLPSLLLLWPKIISFIISFTIIGIFWMGHSVMFHFIKRSDRLLIWMNNLLLMLVSFIPFPAALIGEYAPERTSVILYGSVLSALGVLYMIIWAYASHHHRLIDKSLPPDIIRTAFLVISVAPIIYAIAVALAFVNPLITLIIYIIVPVIYIIPSPVDDIVDFASQDSPSN